MTNFFKLLFLVSAIFFKISFLSQATFTSTKNGNWDDNTASTPWSISGSDADGIPDSDDDVVLNDQITQPNDNIRFKTLLINVSGELVLTDGYIAYTYGTLTNNGQISSDGKIITVLNTTISGSGTFSSNIEYAVSGNLIFDNVNLSIARIVTLVGGGDLFVNNGSSINFQGEVKSLSSASVLFNNATTEVSTTNFMTSGQSSSSVFQSNNTSSTLIYSTTGDIPVPVLNQYHNLTISSGASASCSENLSISGNWNNEGDFSSTAIGNEVTFNGSSIQQILGSGTSNFKNLTLNNSSGLNLTAGNINIDEVLLSSDGVISQSGSNVKLSSTSDNNAGLIKIDIASDFNYISGDFTVERFYNATSDGWRMVAAPIEGATLADWDDEFIYCGITAGIGNYSFGLCGSFYSVYTYDESTANPTIDDGLNEVTTLTQNVSDAVGTLIYTSSGATTISVTGNPEFDDISKSITSVNDGWNLVSNPYPSTLDWTNGSSGFYDQNSSLIDNSWWTYSADAGNYVSGVNDIPHSQGFWVKTSSGGNLDYSVSQTTGSQATFIKSTNGINLPLKLKVSSDANNYHDFAFVITGDNFSNNYDPGQDIFKFFTPYPDYVPNVYFLDNSGNKLDRTCINNNQTEDLYFDVQIGQFASGNYTIEFDNLSSFMIGSCLNLEDLYSGIITDLRVDSLYTFLSDSNAPSPRFILHIDVDYDINVTNSICYNDSSASISFSGNNISGNYVNLINDSGVIIDSIMALNDTVHFSGLNSGIYTYNTNHIGTCAVQNQDIVIIEPEEITANFSLLRDTFYLDTNGEVQVYIKNHSLGASFYYWDFGDGNFSHDNNPSHIYLSSGLFTLKLFARGDSTGVCEDVYEKSIIVIDPFLNVPNKDLDEITVFADNYNLKIQSTNYNSIKNCEIFSVNGKIVKSFKLNSINSSINISDLSNGYFLIRFHFSDPTDNYSIKFFKGE